MAAHGLTIARQLIHTYNEEGPRAFLEQARCSLGAPGFDVGASDPGTGYSKLYRGVQDGDVELALRGAASIAKRLAFLDGYSCLEDATTAYRSYVYHQTAYSAVRADHWYTGKRKAHPHAKPGSAPRFPHDEATGLGIP